MKLKKGVDKRIQNLINGELLPPESNSYLDNYNPALGITYSYIPDSDEREVEAAVAAAKAAFPMWSQKTAEFRSRLMNRMADLIEQNLDLLASVESDDNGKPYSLAKRVDIPRAAANFRFFASGILHFSSESHNMDRKAINYTLRQPIGVVGCISPWNLPLYLFTWKIAPALATGNTVVAKPSEITPMTAYLLSKIANSAGIPPGVLNIIHGTGPKVGAGIVAHKDVKAISFTGGNLFVWIQNIC